MSYLPAIIAKRSRRIQNASSSMLISLASPSHVQSNDVTKWRFLRPVSWKRRKWHQNWRRNWGQVACLPFAVSIAKIDKKSNVNGLLLSLKYPPAFICRSVENNPGYRLSQHVWRNFFSTFSQPRARQIASNIEPCRCFCAALNKSVVFKNVFEHLFIGVEICNDKCN